MNGRGRDRGLLGSRAMRRFLIAWMAAASLFGAAAAHAQDAEGQAEQAPPDPSALFARASTAEQDGRPVEALEAWRALVSAAPTSRLASRARARIAWIEARSEGDYAPLAAMMAFLDAPPGERDAERVRAFEQTVATMPAGRVRAESRVAVGSDWARLGRTEDALEAWRIALGDDALNEGERTMVRESMARARMDAGDVTGAIDELEDADLGGGSFHRFAERQLRRETWVPIALGALALFVVFVLALVVQSGQPGRVLHAVLREPLRLAVAVAVGLGPTAIVHWWGDESLGAFDTFAPCSIAIILLSYAASEATESRRARAAAGALAFAAALAGAYLSVALYGEALPFA